MDVYDAGVSDRGVDDGENRKREAVSLSPRLLLALRRFFFVVLASRCAPARERHLRLLGLALQ